MRNVTHARARALTIRAACLCMAALLLCTMLSACGSQLSGTYRSTDVIAQTFTFSGNTVTMSAFGINASGTYVIEGDSIVITYSIFGLENTWRQSFSQSGSSIYIGGTEFVKQ